MTTAIRITQDDIVRVVRVVSRRPTDALGSEHHATACAAVELGMARMAALLTIHPELAAQMSGLLNEENDENTLDVGTAFYRLLAEPPR